MHVKDRGARAGLGERHLGSRCVAEYFTYTISELFTIALLLWALITSFYRSWKIVGISVNLPRIIQVVEELES